MNHNNLTIGEYLNTIRHAPRPATVLPESSLKDVVRAMVRGYRRRIVYVLDHEGCLQGSISLHNLKDIVFRHFLARKLGDAVVLSEELVELFSSESADQVMETDVPVCYEDDRFHDILEWMMEANLLDVAVLSRDGKLLGDLDVLDLLEQWLIRSEAF